MTGVITAVSPWFGSKRTLAPRIVQALGKHSAFWDLTCGSAAVFLEKLPCAMETLNDLHGDVINLCRVVQDGSLSVELFRRLYSSPCSEELHAEAAERYARRGNSPCGAVPDLERAFDYFYSAWNGRNGVAGTQSYNQGFCRRFTKNGGAAAKRFASAVESIPAWYERFRNATILNDDMFSLLPRIEDSEGVAIYIDPPYLVKGAKYVHDFTTDDHQRLATAVQRFKNTRVVVSYYDHPRLADLYPGWHIERIEVTKAMVNQGMRDQAGATKAIEVLLVNDAQGRLAL